MSTTQEQSQDVPAGSRRRRSILIHPGMRVTLNIGLAVGVITSVATGIGWAAAAKSDNDKTNERQDMKIERLSEKVQDVKDDLKEIKADIKLLLQRAP